MTTSLEPILARTFPDARWTPGQELRIGAFPQWDSLGHFNLMLAVEEEFDVKFTLDETAKAVSLEAIARLVDEKRARAR